MKLNNIASRWEFLKTMPTQDLDEMLQAELHKENIDDDLVRLILEVLEERETDCPVEINAEVTAAVNKYTTYLDVLEKTPAKPTRKWSVVLKAASVLLVVGLLLFAVPQAVQAESFFEMLARWTDSIFEFFSPGDDNKQPEYVFETDHPGLQQIYDAVVELGVTDPVVPMWVPENFALVECDVINTPKEKFIQAIFHYDNNVIAFCLSSNDEQGEIEYYKDSTDVKKFEFNAITHYVFRNLNRCVAIWEREHTICSVAIDCQEETLFEILKSIYTMEED